MDLPPVLTDKRLAALCRAHVDFVLDEAKKASLLFSLLDWVVLTPLKRPPDPFNIVLNGSPTSPSLAGSWDGRHPSPLSYSL